jgi:biopolymer transport protein ExbD
MVTDENGEPVLEIKPGQTVYALNNPRRVITVSNPADFQMRDMSTYDELKNRLMKVKERFRDAEDANDIIIAAENEVLYDKIIQLMDVARAADYPNISIAKLRG